MCHVLLVEDSDDIRELMVEFLEGEGFQVLEACNGQQALDALESSPAPIDLVLLDLAMPVMDGVTFVHRLELDERHASLPVIMISANPRPPGTTRANFFLQKPSDLHQVLKLARDLVPGPR